MLYEVITMIASTDDAINATKGSATEMNDGSCLYVNGGLIAINASSGDGLDSNGNIEMNSGTVIVRITSYNVCYTKLLRS